MNSKKQLKELHAKNSGSATGSVCTCPSCGTEFVKASPDTIREYILSQG